MRAFVKFHHCPCAHLTAQDTNPAEPAGGCEAGAWGRLWWVAVVRCCGVSIFEAAVMGRLWWATVVGGGGAVILSLGEQV